MEGFRTLKYVIGNKKDLKLRKGVLSQEDLDKLNAYDDVYFQEVSALTNYAVREVFDEVILTLNSYRQQAQVEEEDDDEDEN